jgi:uncharacterized protein YndB with AHSA1/START domain
MQMTPAASPNTNPDGALIEVDGRPALRFERHLDHPVGRVWAALTETDDLKRWHPSPFELDARPGGAVTFLEPEEEWGPDMPPATLVEFEPERVLAHAWGEDMLRWQLTPDGDGCRLVLLHTFDDRNKAARDGAGWHICLDGLEEVLAGTAEGTHDDRNPPAWPELNAAYQRRFGISPDQATPPPSGHPDAG